MRFLLCLLFFGFSNYAMADVSLQIENIDNSSIDFKRRGVIPMGPMEMFFSDEKEQKFVLSCGGSNLYVRILQSPSFSNLAFHAHLEECHERLIEMRKNFTGGQWLQSLEFEFAKRKINDRVTGVNEVFMYPTYRP